MSWYPCCCLPVHCSVYLPVTLNWLLTVSGGTCSCGWHGQSGTVTRAGGPGNYNWDGNVTGCYDGVGTTPNTFRLRCQGTSPSSLPSLVFPLSGLYPLGGTYACTASPNGGSSSTISTSPVQLTFSGPIASVIGYPNPCPCAGMTWTMTFTP